MLVLYLFLKLIANFTGGIIIVVAKNFTNFQVAKLLRSVAAALILKKKNLFQIRAYEQAADSIEKLDSEIQDIWNEGRLDDVPGLGKNLTGHLDQLFKTGKVKHFEDLKKGLGSVIFELLDIPLIGPKTALNLADKGVRDIDDLKTKIKDGFLVSKGFSQKLAEKILSGIEEVSQREGRMLLPYASSLASRILEYLRKSKDIEEVEPLGSLRRMVATIGDIDFAASSKNPKKVVEYFVKMPGVSRIIDQGENKASVVLNSGFQADLLVGEPQSYGALLQHFTGSKQHNIHLRKIALEKRFSLSEYGIKKVKNSKLKFQSDEILYCKTEEELYSLLGMDTPPPEIREDTGEVEAAMEHKLPKLIENKEIKGDLHLHSNFPMEHPSHGPGANSLAEIVKKAIELGYEFVGISDHPPGANTTGTKQQIKILKKRNKEIEQLKYSYKSKIRVLNGLEIDILPNGTLSVPNQMLESLDYCIAGVHSVHKMDKDKMTQRILKALKNPFVDILAHPTNRLLNERESSEAEWEKIFKFCAKEKKLLEINAYPNRLDLRDDLVRQAKNYGVFFIINTDAHQIEQMANMPFGVAVARRGWARSTEVVNSWDWTKFANWFNIR